MPQAVSISRLCLLQPPHRLSFFASAYLPELHSVTYRIAFQDDALEFELFDWDLEGAPDAMGAFTLPLTSQLLAACRRLPGQVPSLNFSWCVRT